MFIVNSGGRPEAAEKVELFVLLSHHEQDHRLEQQEPEIRRENQEFQVSMKWAGTERRNYDAEINIYQGANFGTLVLAGPV